MYFQPSIILYISCITQKFLAVRQVAILNNAVMNINAQLWCGPYSKGLTSDEVPKVINLTCCPSEGRMESGIQ